MLIYRENLIYYKEKTPRKNYISIIGKKLKKSSKSPLTLAKMTNLFRLKYVENIMIAGLRLQKISDIKRKFKYVRRRII